MSTAAVPRWGLGDAVAGWVIAVVASIFGIGLFAQNGTVTLAALAAGQAGLWAGLLGTVWRSSRVKGAGDLAEDFGLGFERSDFAIPLVLGVLCQRVLVPLIYIPLRQVIDEHQLEEPARELARTAHGRPYLGFAIAVVVVAPIVEELFFRGLVLRSIQRRFGPTWAVVGSSLLFGLAHVQGPQLPALVAVGVVFGVLAVRTGRLGPGIVAHAAFNAVAVIALARA